MSTEEFAPDHSSPEDVARHGARAKVAGRLALAALGLTLSMSWLAAESLKPADAEPVAGSIPVAVAMAQGTYAQGISGNVITVHTQGTAPQSGETAPNPFQQEQSTAQAIVDQAGELHTDAPEADPSLQEARADADTYQQPLGTPQELPKV